MACGSLKNAQNYALCSLLVYGIGQPNQVVSNLAFLVDTVGNFAYMSSSPRLAARLNSFVSFLLMTVYLQLGCFLYL